MSGLFLHSVVVHGIIQVLFLLYEWRHKNAGQNVSPKVYDKCRMFERSEWRRAEFSHSCSLGDNFEIFWLMKTKVELYVSHEF